MAKSKKDFTGAVNTISNQISDAVTDTTAQEEAEAQRIRMAQKNLRTQGVAGAKLPRINLAFDPDVYTYIRVMAGVRGQTMTQFVNDVMQQSIADNADVYAQAKALKEQFT